MQTTRWFDPNNWTINRPRKYLILVAQGHTAETYPTVNCVGDLSGVTSPRRQGQQSIRGGSIFKTSTFKKNDYYNISMPNSAISFGLQEVQQQKRRDKREGKKSDWTLNELMGLEEFNGLECKDVNLEEFFNMASDSQSLSNFYVGLDGIITNDGFKGWTVNTGSTKYIFGDDSGKGSTKKRNSIQKKSNTPKNNSQTKKMVTAVMTSLLQIQAEEKSRKTFDFDEEINV